MKRVVEESQKHSNLSNAKRVKNDEFYTRYDDISLELCHYNQHFVNKHIYLNCDNPSYSQFYAYFMEHFYEFNLRKLTATYYDNKNTAYMTAFDGITKTTIPLNGNGSFDSEECIALLHECDIVVTNPPFSLFRRFFSTLTGNSTDFIIIGNSNSLLCKEIFPYIQSNKVHVGRNKPKLFTVPDDYYAENIKNIDGIRYAIFGNICWYSTLLPDYTNEPLSLSKHYDEIRYQRYSNYNAIEVNKVQNIPCDYTGIMGVPISFIDKYCPEQFNIVWQASGNTRACCPPDILKAIGYVPDSNDRGGAAMVNGQRKYSRLLIQKC